MRYINLHLLTYLLTSFSRLHLCALFRHHCPWLALAFRFISCQMRLCVATSDVKFHDFLPWNISWNISEIFQKFHDDFFRLYTYPFKFFIRKTSHFIHLCILQPPKPIWSLFAWFACLSTGSKLGLSSDYYDVRRTRYSPVAVTEVKVSVKKATNWRHFTP